jgi:outer membrane translocation and assembly module TamA
VFLAASRETSFFAGQTPDTGPAPIGIRHERLVETGVVFPVTHVRFAERARASVLRALDDFTLAGDRSSLNRSSARLSWSAATAHLFGNSVSFERGAALGVTTELVRRSLGASADATSVTADTRFYLPGLGEHHVFALRLAGGATTGDSHVGRAFLLGGPGPNGPVTSFGSDAITLLRGFDANTFAGLHVAVMNVEYRLPLARIERGVGALPVFLHAVHVSAFMDAGNTWNKTFSSRNLKTSLGAELSADVVAGYFYPFTAAIGAAWGHDASHTFVDRTTVYFRIGRAF